MDKNTMADIMNNIKKDINIYLGIGAVLVAAAYFLLGFTGAKVVLGILLLFFLPLYLILHLLGFDKGESIIFGLVMGFGFYPVPAYYLAFIFGSLMMSIAVTSVTLYLATALLWYLLYIKKGRKPLVQNPELVANLSDDG